MEQTDVKSINYRPQIRSQIMGTGLLILFLVLFVWFIVLPKNRAYSEIKSQITELDSEKVNLYSGVEDLNKLVSELSSAKSDVKLLDEALPLSDRATRIAILIESYANSTAMQLSQLNIQDMEKDLSAGNKAVLDKPFDQERSLQTVQVNITVDGTVEQFKNFLLLLETSGRIIDVESFTVNQGDELDRFNLTISTYAYEPK